MEFKKNMNIIARTAAVVSATALLSVGLYSSPGLQKIKANNERPNVVLIVADDLGYGDNRLTNPNSEVNTTHIKSIADNGVSLTNGYVASPVCSPSRTALLSSEYPSRFGGDSNQSSRNTPGKMPSQTIASLLEGGNGKGYATMSIGKWDVAGRSPQADAYMPIGRGFGGFYGIPGGISSYYRTDGTAPSTAWYYDGTNAKNDGLFTNVNQNLNVKEYAGGSYVNRNPNVYLTDKFTDKALSFIDSQSGTEEDPFFLYLSYNSPHKPYMAEDADYQAASGSGAERLYNAMVKNLDDNVGRILDKLDDKQITDNTMVIFVSDNGSVGAGSAGVLRGGKQTLFEGGIHTSWAMQWPDKYTTPSVFDKPVSTLDILPTIAVAAGYALSNIDTAGTNLTPYILGNNTNDPHDSLFWRYIGDDTNSASLAIRSGDYKYIIETEQDQTQTEYLFDLQNDLQEQTNLIADSSYATILSSLKNDLDEWNKDNPLDEDFDDDLTDGWIEYNDTTTPVGDWDINSYYKYKITDGRSGDRSIAQMTYFEDAVFEADLKLKTTGKAGVIFHSSNHSTGSLNFNGYFAHIESGNAVTLRRVDNGTATTLGTVSKTITLDTNYHMKIVTSGSNIKVFVDNMTTPLIDVNDSNYSGGSVGVRLGTPSQSATSTAVYDNITVTPQ